MTQSRHCVSNPTRDVLIPVALFVRVLLTGLFIPVDTYAMPVVAAVLLVESVDL
jgi:hypothetical protein